MTDTAETISQNMPCISCGYNLRTLPTRGRCPECGAEVAKSMQSPFMMWGPHLLRRVARILLFIAALNMALVVGTFAMLLAGAFIVSATSPLRFRIVLAMEIGAYMLFSILHFIAARLLSRPPNLAGYAWWPTENISASIGAFAFSMIPLGIVVFCMFSVEIPAFIGIPCLICFLFVTIPALAFYGYRLGDFLADLCSCCEFNRLGKWFVYSGRAAFAGLFGAEFLALLSACIPDSNNDILRTLCIFLVSAGLIVAAAGFVVGTVLLFIAASRFRKLAMPNASMS